MRVARMSGLLSLLGLNAACTDNIGRGQEQGVREIVQEDSSGVEIITIPDAELEDLPRWVLSETPTVVIGGAAAADEQALSSVTDALELANGEIVVVDGGTQQLRFFDQSGAFLRAIGGRGEGPGEFGRIAHIDRHAAGIAVIDRGQQRVTVVDPGGQVLETRPWSGEGCPRQTYESIGYRCEPEGAMLDGTIVTRQVIRASPGRGGSVPRVATGLTAWFGIGSASGVRIVDSLPRPDEVVLRTEEGLALGRRPFAPAEAYAIGGKYLALGAGHPFTIRLRDSSGALVRIMRVERAARRVLESDVDSVRATPIGNLLIDLAAPLDSVPHFDGLLFDALDRLWVRRAEGGSWWVFDERGAPVAEVTPAPMLPSFGGIQRAVQVVDAGDDYVLTLHRDEYEAFVVHRYAVLK